MPVLKAQLIPQANKEGLCGYFVRVRKWQVENPVEGIIVQEIVRTFNVEKYVEPFPNNTQALQNIDNYIQDPNSKAFASELHYWEAWTVDSSGNVSDGGEDTFSLCSIIPLDTDTAPNSTKGTYTMKGSAKFYPTNSKLDTLGFTRNTVGAAGGLYSRTTNPTTTSAFTKLVAADGTVDYSVTVTWDSTTYTSRGRDLGKMQDSKAYSTVS